MDEFMQVVKATSNEVAENFRLASVEFPQDDPRIWCGVIAAIITFGVEVILCSKKIIFSGHEKNIARAIKEGHVATATLETQYSSTDYTNPRNGKKVDRYHGRYVYEVNGIKGKVHVSSSGRLPYMISVYWKKTPKKVFTDWKNSSFLDNFIWIVYIIPILVFYWVARLMGYDFG